MSDERKAGSNSDPGRVTPASRWASAPPHLQELLALAVDLARDAGRAHIEGRRHALHTQTKSSPTDLVSQVDKEAERLIVDRLRELRPDDGLLGEEGAQSRGHERRALGDRPARRHDELRLRLSGLRGVHRR